MLRRVSHTIAVLCQLVAQLIRKPCVIMRLLERLDSGAIRLTEDLVGDGQIHPYAILSHTWERDHNKEVSYQDMKNGTGRQKSGFAKIELCAAQAHRDNLRHFWIDTCCIDQSSSAELSEAINSMFAWYRDAAICYAYLRDVVDEAALGAQDFQDIHEKKQESTRSKAIIKTDEKTYNLPNFTRSRWFGRGWTLQELIAPKVVNFYGRDWAEIGTKAKLSHCISQKTGIPERILGHESLHSCPVAQRMSWLSERETTRVEDQAYCLLGIFGVNMPLIYGEGKRSFVRLQLAILDQEEDYSILAWASELTSGDSSAGLLATSAAEFSAKAYSDTRLATAPTCPAHPITHYKPAKTRSAGCRKWLRGWLLKDGGTRDQILSNTPYYERMRSMNLDSLRSYVPSRAGSRTGSKLPDCLSIRTPREPARVTSRGIHLSLPVKTSHVPGTPSVAWIYCFQDNHLLCILLEQTSDSMVFARHSPAWLVRVDPRYLGDFEMTDVYAHSSGPVTPKAGISGWRDPIHVAIEELGEAALAVERRNTQKEPRVVERRAHQIRLLVNELRHIHPLTISVERHIDISWLDRLKIYAEDFTARPWGWTRPKRPCTHDSWHMEWTCVCGKKEWNQAPQLFAQGVLNLISQKKVPQINEVFWGLHAREEMSFTVVLAYHIGALILPLGFWVWWIRRHPGALEDASLPLFVSLCLLSLVWITVSKAAPDKGER